MSTPTIPLASLRFDGERFENHSLDVDCVGELTAYKRLVMECAKELWRRANPEYERLPKGFEESLTLQFDEVASGSAVIPLRRVLVQQQPALDFADDEFDQAAALIDDAIAAADSDNLLPAAFPRNVIPLFRDFGRSLRDSETLYVQSRQRSTAAPYTAKARQQLADWTEATYEDAVDVVGEVCMANVRGGAFEVTVAVGQPAVKGKFSEAQEAEVLNALQSHATTRLRVRGMGEFAQSDRQLRKLVRVDSVSAASMQEPEFVDGPKPIWETLTEIGASIPDGVWAQVPTDLSKRLDHYLYSSNEAD
ncbi:MAG: hypothetical protein ACR2GP_13290 [Burkholderiaceae bacterium]